MLRTPSHAIPSKCPVSFLLSIPQIFQIYFTWRTWKCSLTPATPFTWPLPASLFLFAHQQTSYSPPLPPVLLRFAFLNDLLDKQIFSSLLNPSIFLEHDLKHFWFLPAPLEHDLSCSASSSCPSVSWLPYTFVLPRVAECRGHEHRTLRADLHGVPSTPGHCLFVDKLYQSYGFRQNSHGLTWTRKIILVPAPSLLWGLN